MNYLIFNEFKQSINFYLLPKNPNDRFLVDMPVIIFEPIYNWINDKNKLKIFLLSGSSRFTFTGSYVSEHKIHFNRYNIESRELIIKFDMMARGFIK